MTATYVAPNKFQSDKATAANAALRAAFETRDSARLSWDALREAFGTLSKSETDENRGEYAARRIAVRLDQATYRAFGVVSASACGLYFVTASGQVGRVDSTDGGSDYLTAVDFLNRETGTMRHAGELPVSEVVTFYDTLEDAQDAA